MLTVDVMDYEIKAYCKEHGLEKASSFVEVPHDGVYWCYDKDMEFLGTVSINEVKKFIYENNTDTWLW